MNIKIIIRRRIEGTAAQNRLEAYAKGFVAAGHFVSIIYLITQDYNDRSGDIEGCNVIRIWKTDNVFFKNKKICSYIKNLLKLRNYISKGDYVLMYGDQVPIMLSLWSFRKKANIFCEITEHPYHNHTTLLLKVNTALSNHLLKSFDGLFVISRNLVDYYVSMGINKEKVSIINMFVDLKRFNRFFESDINKYIAYCGKVSFRKDGVNDLIKAFKLFSETHSNYRLKIIGGAENDSVIPKLESLAKELNISDKIDFTGEIVPDSMPEMLSKASILALARPNNLQSQNGFPTKLGEYLATGNPVAVTRVGDIPLFIEDCVNGFLADPDDPESFADALSKAAYDSESGKNVGYNGRILCEKDFSNLSQANKAIKIMMKASRV